MQTKTFSTKPIRVALFAVLVGTVAATAGDTPGGATVCVGLSALKPQTSSLTDRSGAGLGASLSCEWTFKKRHALRAGFEFTKFGGKTYYDRPHDPGVPTKEYEGSANVAFATLDYAFGFVSHNRGLYVAIGTGCGKMSVQPDGIDGVMYGDTISGLGFRYAAGVGYNFTKNLGLEVSAVATSTYESSRQRGGGELFGWQQATLRYRFSTLGGAK
jgi:opacity protein-like surface antigen